MSTPSEADAVRGLQTLNLGVVCVFLKFTLSFSIYRTYRELLLALQLLLRDTSSIWILSQLSSSLVQMMSGPVSVSKLLTKQNVYEWLRIVCLYVL